MSEFAVDAARAFFSAAPSNSGKPYQANFSTETSSPAINGDALKFATQLVTQINQSQGVDTNTKTLNIDEFTRFVSGDEFKKFSEITDPSEKALVEATFKEISGNRSQATAQNLADYVRVRDIADGSTDGEAVLNFLI